MLSLPPAVPRPRLCSTSAWEGHVALPLVVRGSVSWP
jgi:hypothetical protein